MDSCGSMNDRRKDSSAEFPSSLKLRRISPSSYCGTTPDRSAGKQAGARNDPSY